MKRVFMYVMLLFLIAFYCNVEAQCRLDKSNWDVFFSEDFSQSNVASLLSGGNWMIGHPNYPYKWVASCNERYQCYSEDEIRLQDKHAYLGGEVTTPFVCQEHEIAFAKTSLLASITDEFRGLINGSVNGYMWGMFEIKCQLPAVGSTSPAFWLGATAEHTEIDVFEHDGSAHHQFSCNIHFLENGGEGKKSLQNFYTFDEIDLSQDFHTYTVVWTPTLISFFFDGRELNSESDLSHLPGANAPNAYELFKWNKMHLLLQENIGCVDSPGNHTYDPFIIEYVKVYKPHGYVPFLSTGHSTDWDNFYQDQLNLYKTTAYKSTLDCVSSVNRMYVLPNPSTGIFTIQDVGPDATIAINDINGRKLSDVVTNAVNGHVAIDLTKFSAGIYFAVLRAGGGVKCIKLVKY